MFCDTTALGPYLLEDYVLEEARICLEAGVGFIDNYHQDVITKETVQDYCLDGVHLNLAGRTFLAENIVAAIQRK